MAASFICTAAASGAAHNGPRASCTPQNLPASTMLSFITMAPAPLTSSAHHPTNSRGTPTCLFTAAPAALHRRCRPLCRLPIVPRPSSHCAAPCAVQERLARGEGLPQYIKDHIVYYAGPAKTPQGYASGSFGPTTAGTWVGWVCVGGEGGPLLQDVYGRASERALRRCVMNMEGAGRRRERRGVRGRRGVRCLRRMRCGERGGGRVEGAVLPRTMLHVLS